MSDPFDKYQDPFAPPKVPCVVCCIHCGSTYDSWRIVWRDMPGEAIEGAWCCPIPECDGIGFQFDIHPVDPDWEDADRDSPFSAVDALDRAADEDELDLDEEEDDDEDEENWALSPDFFDEDENEEADEFALPIDEFEENAFWIEPHRILQQRLGNTPQPPFDRPPYGYSNTSDIPIKDDDIPF